MNHAEAAQMLPQHDELDATPALAQVDRPNAQVVEEGDLGDIEGMRRLGRRSFGFNWTQWGFRLMSAVRLMRLPGISVCPRGWPRLFHYGSLAPRAQAPRSWKVP